MQTPMMRSVVLVCLATSVVHADSGTLPNGATLMSFTVTATVLLAVPQLGLLWLVTVNLRVAVPA